MHGIAEYKITPMLILVLILLVMLLLIRILLVIITVILILILILIVILILILIFFCVFDLFYKEIGTGEAHALTDKFAMDSALVLLRK